MATSYEPPSRPDSPENIAPRLLNARKALNVKKQKDFAKAADIAANTYNQWEKAKGRPDLDQAMRLCRAHSLTLDYIYFGKTDGLPHSLAMKIAQLERENTKSQFSDNDAKPPISTRPGV